jgi:ribosomal subunit interface protein
LATVGPDGTPGRRRRETDTRDAQKRAAESGILVMAFRVSGKNMDIGDALRTRVTDRVNQALSKYFDGTASGHVIVRAEGSGYATETVLHLSSGITLHAEGHAQDAYASADDAATHIEKRLRRYKRRLKDHQADRATQRGAPVDVASYVLAAPNDDDGAETAPETGEYHPVIIAESTTGLKRLSVGAAVMELDLSGAPFLVFRHGGHGGVNIVYRRPDGNIGWIDAAAVAGQA